MEDYKYMSVWDLLNFLKIRVKYNVDLINLNIIELNELKGEPQNMGADLTDIKNLTKENADLTLENNHFLSLFNDLLKLQNKYFLTDNSEPVTVGNDQKVKIKSEEEQNKEYFEKTINGEIPIDNHHPLKNNRELLQNLFNYYLDREEYERCAILKKIME